MFPENSVGAQESCTTLRKGSKDGRGWRSLSLKGLNMEDSGHGDP